VSIVTELGETNKKAWSVDQAFLLSWPVLK